MTSTKVGMAKATDFGNRRSTFITKYSSGLLVIGGTVSGNTRLLAMRSP